MIEFDNGMTKQARPEAQTRHMAVDAKQQKQPNRTVLNLDLKQNIQKLPILNATIIVAPGIFFLNKIL